ncbi:hypothetical protein VOLCADRAFT_115592 [Volvox carteri f. nagariensis]|uniref:Lebercilin domain-containing protein n=1 Tax=Volvox carteri f. nagariensis TaxID=3068 RepID=D8TH32_VOLCA|nr:uncharacterized protein VOLCADRAFT_115592 [Volvox carteri f. nagariensis]EFJ52639.1 hypothetical protein VOLCADRAFT_115592 [Volvox carteri f. nagariensis]|eukprot:XP_002945644.1 hypothetical protein VOLCADRAFT_115592 [Volvox carteri f. nagariensis]
MSAVKALEARKRLQHGSVEILGELLPVRFFHDLKSGPGGQRDGDTRGDCRDGLGADYIASMECLAADQKRELEKVREEKRDMERCLARAEVAAQERAPGPVLDFSVSEVADLPPRLRALVEDNRGLRELVKRYKFRTASLEHQVGQLQSQVLALTDANERLKQSLAECSRTPAEVDREETLRRQLELKIRHVENLDHGMSVLRAKMETDSKLYRQNLASAAREKDALKRQLVATNKTLEDRDKEVSGDEDAGGTAAAAAGAAAASAAAAAPPPEAAALTAPASKPSLPPPDGVEERIRIMLLIVRDEVRVEVPVPMLVDTPATPLAGSPRGCTDAAEERPWEGPDEEPQPSTEGRVEIAPQVDPEPAPQLSAPEPVTKSAPEPVPEPVAPEPAPEPEPPAAAAAEVELQAPEPLGEEASAIELAPGGTTTIDGGYEPSVVGLLEEGALLAEASVGSPEVLAALEDGDAAAAEADATDAAEAPPLDAAGNGSGGAMHVHASPPLPVPYSRTAARALAAKVGGISAKISAGPHGPAAAGAAAAGAAAAAPVPTGPVRKHSGGGAAAAGAGAAAAAGAPVGAGAVGVRGGSSQKAVGAASKR